MHKSPPDPDPAPIPKPAHSPNVTLVQTSDGQDPSGLSEEKPTQGHNPSRGDLTL